MADVDVASLGLTVDATQVAAAQRILQQFSQSGNQATATVVNFNAATGQFNQGITGTIAQFGRAQAAMASWGALTAQGTIATNQVATATRTAGQAAAISAQQWQFLGFQLNDILTGLASGQSPFTILAQQGGQVYQSLAGPQGVVASLREIGRYVIDLITPARLLGVGLAAGAGLAVRAWAEFTSTNREVTISLQGMGRILGVNVDQFRAMTDAAGQSGSISSKSAIELGNALARTGRIGVENIGNIIKLSRDFGTTFGLSTKDLEKALVSAFGSGLRGIEQLNNQYNFLDARTQRYVQSLFTQGRAQEAIAVAQEKLRESLVRTDDNLTQAAGLWERIKRAVSDADTAAGAYLAKLERQAPQQNLQAMAVNVERLRAAEQSRGGIGTVEQPAQPGGPVLRDTRPPTVASTVPLPPGRPTELQGAEYQMNRLRVQMEEQAATRLYEETNKSQLAEAAQRSREIQGQIDRYNPAGDRLREMKDIVTSLEQAQKPGNEALLRSVTGAQDYAEALSIARNQRDSLTGSEGEALSQQDQVIQRNEVENRQRREFSAEGRGRLAAEETEINNRGRAITQGQNLIEQRQAEFRVTDAAKVAIEEHNNVLDRESALYGKVGREREIATQLLQIELQYRQAGQQLNAADLAAFAARIARQTDLNNVQRQLDTIYNNSIKPAEDYQNVLRAGNALLALGKINVNQYALAIDEARIKMLQSQQTMAGGLQAGLLTVAKDFGNVSKGMETMVTSAATTISSSLTDIVVGTKSAKEGFRDMAGSILRNIIEMTIRMTIMAPIARGLTGLLGGGIGSFFGGGTGGVGGIGAELLGGGEFLGAKFAGGFASGGSIGSGKWGIVGERGPEIVKGPADVIPSSTGTSIHYAPVLDMRGASGITEGQVQNLLAQHFVVVKQTLPGLINDARTRRRI